MLKINFLVIILFTGITGINFLELRILQVNLKENFSEFNVALWKYGGETGTLIPLLQSAQSTYGYIPESAINYISKITGIPRADIYGVVTFYAQFRLKPVGKYVVKICNGTACHVNNAKKINEAIEEELGITYDETTEDGLKTAVIYYIKELKKNSKEIPLADIAAGFQYAIVDILSTKAIRAAEKRGCKTLALAGGVACNGSLRDLVREKAEKKGIHLIYPPPILCTDNAAMIACAGYYKYLKGEISNLELDVFPNMEL